MRTWTFFKGHGTANDFVIVRDRHALLSPTPEDIRFICDRRRGIGGDGFLRVTKAGHFPEWDGDPDLWFMDFRNADGSIAEMCGNGARVFARYLIQENLASGDQLDIATRAGLVHAVLERDGRITVTLGQPTRRSRPTLIHACGRDWPAHVVAVGNPHAVVWLSSQAELEAIDLRQPELPVADYPEGGNTEFVCLFDETHLGLRVWERGVGETQSCGTGMVAAAFDHLSLTGDGAGSVRVTAPGGSLDVRVDQAGVAHLTGPAVIVGRGNVFLPCE